MQMADSPKAPMVALDKLAKDNEFAALVLYLYDVNGVDDLTADDKPDAVDVLPPDTVPDAEQMAMCMALPAGSRKSSGVCSRFSVLAEEEGSGAKLAATDAELLAERSEEEDEAEEEQTDGARLSQADKQRVSGAESAGDEDQDQAGSSTRVSKVAETGLPPEQSGDDARLSRVEGSDEQRASTTGQPAEHLEPSDRSHDEVRSSMRASNADETSVEQTSGAKLSRVDGGDDQRASTTAAPAEDQELSGSQDKVRSSMRASDVDEQSGAARLSKVEGTDDQRVSTARPSEDLELSGGQGEVRSSMRDSNVGEARASNVVEQSSGQRLSQVDGADEQRTSTAAAPAENLQELSGNQARVSMRASDVAEKGLPSEQSSGQRLSRLDSVDDQRTSTGGPTESMGLSEMSESQAEAEPSEHESTTERKSFKKADDTNQDNAN